MLFSLLLTIIARVYAARVIDGLVFEYQFNMGLCQSDSNTVPNIGGSYMSDLNVDSVCSWNDSDIYGGLYLPGGSDEVVSSGTVSDLLVQLQAHPLNSYFSLEFVFTLNISETEVDEQFTIFQLYKDNVPGSQCLDGTGLLVYYKKTQRTLRVLLQVDSGANCVEKYFYIDNTWNDEGRNHIVITNYKSDGSSYLAIYVNGAFFQHKSLDDGFGAANFVADGVYWYSDARLYIGKDDSQIADVTKRGFKGTIHLAAMYNRALSLEEISDNYNAGILNNCSFDYNVDVLEDASTTLDLKLCTLHQDPEIIYDTIPSSNEGVLRNCIDSSCADVSIAPFSTFNKSIIFDPPSNEYGYKFANFSYHVCDDVCCSFGSVSLNIAPVNDPPTPTPLTNYITYGSSLVSPLLNGTDIDVVDLKLTQSTVAIITKLPTYGQLYQVDDNLTPITEVDTVVSDSNRFVKYNLTSIDGLPSVVGEVIVEDTFEFKLRQGASLLSLTTGTISITVNNPLSISPQVFKMSEGDCSGFSLVGESLDDSDINWFIDGIPSEGSIYLDSNCQNPFTGPSLSGNTFYYLPSGDFYGNDTFLVYAKTDIGLKSSSQLCTIMVSPVNDPPLVTGPPAFNLTVGEAFVTTLFDVSDVDVDAQIAVTFSSETGSLTFKVLSSNNIVFSLGNALNGGKTLSFSGENLADVKSALLAGISITASNSVNSSDIITFSATDTIASPVSLTVDVLNIFPRDTDPGTGGDPEPSIVDKLTDFEKVEVSVSWGALGFLVLCLISCCAYHICCRSSRKCTQEGESCHCCFLCCERLHCCCRIDKLPEDVNLGENSSRHTKISSIGLFRKYSDAAANNS